MKKFLLVVVLVAAIFICGCGGEKVAEKSEPEKIDSVLVAGSFWALDAENMEYLADALNRNDKEYLNQLMLEGKVFRVDKDTKVVTFGVTADENNVLIQFKEGRYTNKAGCTLKSNVFTEEEYPSYLSKTEAEKKAKEEALAQEVFINLQDLLSSTENYLEAITSVNLEEEKRLVQVCSDAKNKTIEIFAKYGGLGFYDCIEKTESIIKERYDALTFHLKAVEYSGNIKKQEHFMKGADEHVQKAEQLRQEFRNKYGF